jgi:hypothetical protein
LKGNSTSVERVNSGRYRTPQKSRLIGLNLSI